MTNVNKSDKDRVIIFDTTLRDGEQCPGATMTFEEKLEVAEMLDDMGVDVIEAASPSPPRATSRPSARSPAAPRTPSSQACPARIPRTSTAAPRR